MLRCNVTVRTNQDIVYYSSH